MARYLSRSALTLASLTVTLASIMYVVAATRSAVLASILRVTLFHGGSYRSRTRYVSAWPIPASDTLLQASRVESGGTYVVVRFRRHLGDNTNVARPVCIVNPCDYVFLKRYEVRSNFM